VLIVPALVACLEWPRRLATAAGAQAGLFTFKLGDLVRALAEPALLGSGLAAWDSGLDALLAARLLDGPHGLRLPPELPRRPLARVLARTLRELRAACVAPALVAELAEDAATHEDVQRLRALAQLYGAYHTAVEGRLADPTALLRMACERLPETTWLREAEVLVVGDLETDALEREFLLTLARSTRLRLLAHVRPARLASGSLSAWAAAQGVPAVPGADTLLAPLLTDQQLPASLLRLRANLFEPPTGAPVEDAAVELVSAPGEAAEVRALARRLLQAARAGWAFEDMGVILPRPEEYAPLVSDLFTRLGLPFRLHPSLPLRLGRAARALLLLLRCRGLERAAVLDFLTFAPVPFAELLGDDVVAEPARWDELSRQVRIVSGLDRWMVGLRHLAEQERQATTTSAGERARRLERAADAEALLRVVELISGTLDGLAGSATWPEWSERLGVVVDQWIAPQPDREVLVEVLVDLRACAAATERAEWHEVEAVLEARLEWERLPLTPVAGGAVHVGALDAMAGLPFRLLAIVGLVEGGYPGVQRPDPFLLDAERRALERRLVPAPVAARPATALAPRPARRATRRSAPAAQLALFGDEASELAPPPSVDGDPVEPDAPPPRLPTSQDHLQAERRRFQHALAQAQQRLILSYPRAEARSGRERMPSLFFVAAASAIAGAPLSAAQLGRVVHEDDLDTLSVEDALDPGERERLRLRQGGREAAQAIAAGSSFFKQSRLASEARWSNVLTAYDGLAWPLAPELVAGLDPRSAPRSMSASQLATYTRCGFQYLLRYVLGLEPALEPEERKRLEPLERGLLFHSVAERFLRALREREALPVLDTPDMRAELAGIADEALDELVAGSPPRFRVLWERERERFHELLRAWLRREALLAARARPAHFEIGFGVRRGVDSREPHSPEPLEIDIGGAQVLRVSGKIDRIDRRPDGTLVLRDYKTGRAPRDDGRVFRGGAQLQIPFYVLAAERLWPEAPVVEAFLDYVDGGRQVAFDPALVRGATFRTLLRGLVDAIAQGLFVQEPSACEWCDFTAVCGPQPLVLRRRMHKAGDARVQRVLRLRDLG
jgi:RecB family exonuclease